MEQGGTAAGAMSPSPVVRQLDFTINLKATANSNARAKANLILPEHPQAQLESKLLALAQSQKLYESANCQSPPRMVAQTKLPPRKMVMPPKSPQRELPGMVAPRLGHPVKSIPAPKPTLLNPMLKSESPKSRERSSYENNDGTPKKQKQCNCRNSRCLKLYCECFAAGVYCDGCNCLNCHNKIIYEDDRKEAISAILERNPNAFRPKIAGSPHGVKDGGVEHNKGCNCKKSGCLKRYCECFQANIPCSNKCKCVECKNFEGSEEQKAHLHHYPSNSTEIAQQAVNAAINGALGTPRKKIHSKQVDSGTTCLPQNLQGTCFTSASYSPLSVLLHKPLEQPKSSYRSPLTGILQLQHVKEMCSYLVEVSAEAASSLSEGRKMIAGANVIEPEISVSSSQHQGSQVGQIQQTAKVLCGNKGHQDGISDGSNIESGRPPSPGTLALMCDEQDVSFMEANTASRTSESNTRTNTSSESTESFSWLYVEQERLVLTRVRDFLDRLITCASMEGTTIEQKTN